MPAQAARQIVDLHRLDAYFALFARDSDVPWHASHVRLDTYSSAPVDFAVYSVDPEDVLTAGSNARPRAVDTRHLHALSTWRFSPPGGYQFQSSEVSLPLGSREGFFVVEARRGNVAEQVWVNRTRIGMLSKETNDALTLYAADLGNGRPYGHMRVQLLVNRHFEMRFTDSHGLLRWRQHIHPVFAIARWGDSRAFLSFFPQAPLPQTILAVRTDAAVVRAGSLLHIAGFARSRAQDSLRASRGTVDVTLRNGPTLIAEKHVALDAAGAFTADLDVPANATAGTYALLAQADGGVGSASVDVEADIGGLELEVRPQCHGVCDANNPVPVVVHATRAGQSQEGTEIHVSVVRSPHGYTLPNDERAWGTSNWYEASLRTDRNGKAFLEIPRPNDGLASTYGVRVRSGGATAVTRIVVPSAPSIVRLSLLSRNISLGTAVDFVVDAWDASSGQPRREARVTVRLAHGPQVQQQVLTLDNNGRVQGSFRNADLGTSIITATLERDGSAAMDASQVSVVPQANQTQLGTTSPLVHIMTTQARVSYDQSFGVSARCQGALGTALITFESALGAREQTSTVSHGDADARFSAHDTIGEVRLGAAFVHDGTLLWNAIPLELDAPGRPVTLSIAPLRNVHAGALEDLHLDGLTGRGTVVVRIASGDPSGAASFEEAPTLLSVGLTTTQTSAPGYPTWHPWVDSSGQHAQVLGFVRRTSPPQPATLAQAQTRTVLWSILPSDLASVPIKLPTVPGRYTLSVLKIADDGRVGAARIQVDIP